MTRKVEHTYKLLIHLALVGCMLGLTTSCSHEDPLVPDVPTANAMAFAADMTDGVAVTRGQTPVTTQFQDFRLYGVKKVTGVLFDVFQDYGFVQQTDAGGNTYWEYATYKMSSGDASRYDKQSYQYWDHEASEYRLIAGAPYSSVTSIDALRGKITLAGLKMGDADKTSEDADNPTYFCPYFSTPMQILPAGFGNLVNIHFQHALCQVRIGFFFETAQEADMLLKDVSFGPAGDGLYATGGDLAVSYVFEPEPKWTAEISSYTSRSNTPLDYADVTVTQPGTALSPSTDAVFCTTSHYMLPTLGNPCIWTLNLTATPVKSGLGEKTKTANVPASDMRWQPNSIYTYIFMVTDTGLEYIKVVQSAVADWNQVSLSDHPVRNW